MSQISINGVATGGTTTIYTVTASTTLFINSLSISATNNSGGIDYAWLAVTNASDVVQYYLYNLWIPDQSIVFDNMSFPKGLQIPAGYKIKVISNVANLRMTAYIHGFEL